MGFKSGKLGGQTIKVSFMNPRDFKNAVVKSLLHGMERCRAWRLSSLVGTMEHHPAMRAQVHSSETGNT